MHQAILGLLTINYYIYAGIMGFCAICNISDFAGNENITYFYNIY